MLPVDVWLGRAPPLPEQREAPEPARDPFGTRGDPDREELPGVGGVVLEDRPEGDLLPPEGPVELVELLRRGGEDDRVAPLRGRSKRGALARGVDDLRGGEAGRKVFPDDDVVLVGAAVAPLVKLSRDLEPLELEGRDYARGNPLRPLDPRREVVVSSEATLIVFVLPGAS